VKVTSHLCTYNADVRNSRFYTTTPPYVFTMRCFVKHSLKPFLEGGFLRRVLHDFAYTESTSKLYRPSDQCLSAKLMQTFADRGVSRGKRGGSIRP
jgi:hypothetical protein